MLCIAIRRFSVANSDAIPVILRRKPTQKYLKGWVSWPLLHPVSSSCSKIDSSQFTVGAHNSGSCRGDDLGSASREAKQSGQWMHSADLDEMKLGLANSVQGTLDYSIHCHSSHKRKC